MKLARLVPRISALLLGAVAMPSTALSQDVRVLNASGPGVWKNPKLIEELRIGSLEGDDEYIFGSVAQIAPLRNGSVVIVDGQGPRVRLYSPQGRYLGDIGRKGEGPGEYRSVVGLDVTPAGEIAIYDIMLQRISLFDTAGKFQRSFRTGAGGSWNGDPFRIDSVGNVYVYAARVFMHTDPSSGNQYGVENHPSNRSIYLKLSKDGIVLDSLIVPKSAVEPKPSFTVITPEGYLQPFTNDFIYALSPHGYLVTAYSNRYAIDRLTPKGLPTRRITRDYTPVRLTRAERALWETWAAYFTKRGGASAGVRIPAVKPAIRDIEFDDDGRMWVNRYARATEYAPSRGRRPDAPPPLTLRDVPTFDVFAPDGKFLGTVEVPKGVRVLHRSGSQAWGVMRGEFDEPYVVRFRIAHGR